MKPTQLAVVARAIVATEPSRLLHALVRAPLNHSSDTFCIT